MHLDGARIFNAAAFLGKSVTELTRSFDSLMFCLSKGLGAPVGSLLVGSKEFIHRARPVRKALGGGMRQAGILAAAGLIALEQGPSRLHEDHATARLLAEGVANIPGIEIDLAAVQTNIVIFDVSGTGKTSVEIAAALKAHGVLAGTVNPQTIRFVTHLNVSRTNCEYALDSLRTVCATIRLRIMTWREYHESTKHSVESLRRAQYMLDWANMPEPFRHYEGVPVLDLPADPPAPEMPALEVLQGACGTTPAVDGPTFLSQLLFYSAAISASKRVPSTGARYALRVNPSSGNLHPTEFHFLTRGLQGWPDGLYHYRPSAHMAEQRALGDVDLKLAGSSAPVVFILTSIAWREAWKYRDRAYRYCLHEWVTHGKQSRLPPEPWDAKPSR